MSNDMAFFDEHGQPAAAVAVATLMALEPLTVNPAATMGVLGLVDPAIEAALVKLGELATSNPDINWRP
ncbi:hypothetical protein [Pseudomonas syringae]|uniref:hypothetical protein n=1 Tax=Pseudomonas syringae TaxID=317 RepID=UPI001F2D0B97|nr:hypothetical protein [Pseudomonas syringae]MCF5226998.1 hypothetical protein [Pseudomonas syringae]MCF5243202.1 hypothetical protein [Pseudomonas syringae]